MEETLFGLSPWNTEENHKPLLQKVPRRTPSPGRMNNVSVLSERSRANTSLSRLLKPLSHRSSPLSKNILRRSKFLQDFSIEEPRSFEYPRYILFRNVKSVFLDANRYKLEQKLAQHQIHLNALKRDYRGKYEFKPLNIKPSESANCPVFKPKLLISEKAITTRKYSKRFQGAFSSRDHYKPTKESFLI
ncbi:unnamed protein product [Blepharisma stoltei]|uniref:Uncharacterized protein n=1 Tax=Blepharisma stoltei TaxID=1481888 RepID=A0AAU9K8Q0_9CILI|nr:unnamed protein product [Blepharisma stoltei]